MRAWGSVGMMYIGAAAVTMLLVVSCRQSDHDLSYYDTFDFAHQRVAPADLARMPLADLRRMRGIAFGRHGRRFREADIQRYLVSRPWYRPQDGFTNAALQPMERLNVDLIRGAEARKHKHVEPGDLRWYRDRPFSRRELGQHSREELRIMRAEIEAVRGARFDEDPALQAYFEERYWYRARPDYRISQLSETEHHNIGVILRAMEESGRNTAGVPGRRELDRMSLYELGVLRARISGRQGWPVPESWLAGHAAQARRGSGRRPAGPQTPVDRRALREIEHREIRVLMLHDAAEYPARMAFIAIPGGLTLPVKLPGGRLFTEG